MARIEPVDESSAPPESRELAAAHAATGGRMTNMKWTLAHSPVALDALLQWYPLHDQVAPVLGERRTWIMSMRSWTSVRSRLSRGAPEVQVRPRVAAGSGKRAR